MLQIPIASIANFPHFRKLVLIIAGLVLLYILHLVYSWFYTQSTDNAYIESDITFVSSEISGIIEEISFTENQYVSCGDKLVKIKQDNYLATLNAAKSELDATELEVNIISTEIDMAQLQIKKLNKEVSFANSNLLNAKKEYDRISSLAEDKFSSKKLADDTLLALKKSQSDYDLSTIALESANKNLIILDAKKQAISFKIEVLQNKLKIAQYNYNDTEIKSPIDGFVTSSAARVGSYVRPGMPIFAVVPKNGMYVKANFKETQIARFKQGLNATIYVDALGNKEIKGKIRNLYPATGSKFSLIPTDNATGNFTKIVQRIPVIIDLQIEKEIMQKLLTGMSCSVYIRTDQ
ncbi:MAG: HlyD family secretion protein [Rickettsiaceae bacterium]|nr:HlyD family secretion protein [Rickettsiaceae bacterium]